MGTLTINDCGTAHETQLLDIYNGLIDAERDRQNKEPTLLEKSNIELQVAEAYQSILKICNDGGQIAKALDILKERAKNVSINELSNIAVDVAVDVFASPTVDGNDIKDVAAFGVTQMMDNNIGDNKFENDISNIQRHYASGSEAEHEIITRAHSKDATAHDKDMYVALSQTDAIDFYNTMGLTFEELDEHDKGFVIKNIRTFMADGKQTEAIIFMQQMGINQECVDEPKWNIYGFEDNTMNPEDAEISRKIGAFSNCITGFIKYYDKLPDVKRNKSYETLIKMYEESDIKIDLGLDSLSTIFMNNEKDCEISEIIEFMERFARDINDAKQNINIDEYMTTRMIVIVNKLNRFKPEIAEQILDGFNKRAKDSGREEFYFENIVALDDKSINTLYFSDESKKELTYEQILQKVRTGKVSRELRFISPGKERGNLRVATNKGNAKSLVELNKETREKKNIAIRNTLNNIYKKDGMKGVMKCMQMRCLESNQDKVYKQDWIRAFASFLDVENNKEVTNGFSQDDIDSIAEMIKNIVNNKKEQLQDDSFLYKFVQLSNDVIKRNNESTILSAEQLDVKSIIENVSGDKMDMFSRKEPSGSEFSER